MENLFLKSFVALSLAFVLQTKLRIFGGIGFGEIGILFFSLFSYLNCLKDNTKIPSLRGNPLIYLFLFYILFILFPVTALNFFFETPGNSLRDLFAYLLSAIFLLAVSVHKEKLKDIVALLIPITLIIVTYHFYGFYFKGEIDPETFGRFTGGAKNPNQTSLYIVCLFILTMLFIENTLLRLFYSGLLIIIGFFTLSDAFVGFLVVFLLVFLATRIVPYRFSLLTIPIISLTIILLLLIFHQELSGLIFTEWTSRDQGNARLILYKNGINAWLSSPFSVVFGNGAGSFSGLNSPFGLYEAHNGPIDTLAMGGLIGLIAFSYYPYKVIFKSFLLNERLLFSLSVGLFLFTSLHFIARHPIYWFTIFMMYIYVLDKSNSRKICVE